MLLVCGCVATRNSASKMTNQSSTLIIYLLHLAVYMAEVQVGMNSCKGGLWFLKYYEHGPNHIKSACSFSSKLHSEKPKCVTMRGHNYVTMWLYLHSYINMSSCNNTVHYLPHKKVRWEHQCDFFLVIIGQKAKQLLRFLQHMESWPVRDDRPRKDRKMPNNSTGNKITSVALQSRIRTKQA